jgi:TetR/AcrR family transcriptional regulator, cholesterol catabolism regulator
MSTMADAPPVDTLLSLRQAERRERILDTALALAAEGGYEAVQMRDVSARAGVALGTLYRYFSSKDHLLAAAWAHWASRLEPRITSRPLRGDTMAERATDFLYRATRAFEREPRLAAAVLTAAMSTDAAAAGSQQEASGLVGRMLLSVMDGLAPSTAAGIRDVLNHVWYSVLLRWVSGRSTVAEVYASLEEACQLLLDPRDPVAAARDRT